MLDCMSTNLNAHRLAHAIRDRRNELNYKQSDLQNNGGPSPETVIKFEQGKISGSPQPRTLEGFDRALRWPIGTAAAMLHGDEHPATAPLPDPQNHVWVAVPRCVIQNMSIAVAKLAIMVGSGSVAVDDEAAALLGQIQSQAQIMSGLVESMDQGDKEGLVSLAENSAPLSL